MKNKYIVLLRTIFVTGIAFVVNYGINLVLTPYITKNVGTEAYGFVTLAKNFAQYATIITTALNSYASRYIAVSYHQNRKDEAKSYFNSVLIGDFILGSGIFLIGIVFSIFLDEFLHIDESILSDVKLLFAITFFTQTSQLKNCAEP